MLDINYKQFQKGEDDEGDLYGATQITKTTTTKQGPIVTRVKTLRNWRPLRHVVPDWTFPNSSSLFVLDCGGEGHCMFHVIAAGLNMFLKKPVFAMQNIRHMLSEQITVANVKELINDWNSPEGLYLRKKLGKQEPSSSFVKEVKHIVSEDRYQTWGDTIMLRNFLVHSPLFTKLELGFAVVSLSKRTIRNNKGETLKRIVASTELIQTKHTKRLLLLYCHPQQHWELLGVKSSSGTLSSVFLISHYSKSLYAFLKPQEITVSKTNTTKK